MEKLKIGTFPHNEGGACLQDVVINLNALADQTTQDIQTEVTSAINKIVGSAPETLDTLDELAAALKDNADVLDLYLTKDNANNTYLSKTDAESTYLKSTDAESTYLNKTTAESDYLKKTDATDTYLSKTDAGSTYLTKSDAATTYVAQYQGKGLSTEDFTTELKTKLTELPDNTTLTSNLSGKANTTHTHAISDVTDLQTTLDGKAATSHNHTVANITDLTTTLSGYATSTALTEGLATKAATSHTHTIANVTDLQSTLDGKAAATHTHTISQITDLDLSGYATTSSVASAVSDATFNSGATTASTSVSIPVTKHVAIISVSAAETMSLDGTLAAGKEMVVILNNTSSGEVIITLPTTGFVNLRSEATITLQASAATSVRFISDGTNIYII